LRRTIPIVCGVGAESCVQYRLSRRGFDDTFSVPLNSAAAGSPSRRASRRRRRIIVRSREGRGGGGGGRVTGDRGAARRAGFLLPTSLRALARSQTEQRVDSPPE